MSDPTRTQRVVGLTRHPLVLGIIGAVVATAVLFFGQALVSAQIGSPAGPDPWEPPYLGARPQLNYQGRLVDPDTGEDMPDGTYSMTFELYTAVDATSGAWAETKNVVASGGLFSTMLGDTNDIYPDLFDHKGYFGDLSGSDNDLWLGIAVNGDAEMTPRQRLGYVPRAAYALSADRLSGVPATEFVTGTVPHTFAVDLAFGESEIVAENGPLSYQVVCTSGYVELRSLYSSTGGRNWGGGSLPASYGFAGVSGTVYGGPGLGMNTSFLGLMHVDGSMLSLQRDSLMLAHNWPQVGRCRASGIYYAFP